MPIMTRDGKIEDTELVCGNIEEEVAIRTAPVTEYHVRTEIGKADKVDCMVAASSDVITATLDILWIGEFSLIDAQNIGADYINRFVISSLRNFFCK